MNRTLVRLIPALLWMALIYYLSAQSTLPIDRFTIAGLLHRLAHIGGYGILALLLMYATGTDRRGLWLALIIASLYGATDEFHQSFTPGRSPGVDEVVLDSLAAGAALLAWSNITRRIGRPAPTRV